MTDDMQGLIERLRGLMADAIPGPWETFSNNLAIGVTPIDESQSDVFHCVDVGLTRKQSEAEANAALVVEAVNALPTLLDALSTAYADGERYRHVKRGTEYQVLGLAELQTADGALVDGSSLVIYKGDDGKLWAREEGEFHDGRFTAIRAAGEQSHGE